MVGSSSLPRPTSPSFWLHSRSTQKVFCKWEKYLRSSSRFALDDPAIRNLQIPYPPDEEDQKKIADDIMQRLARISHQHSEGDYAPQNPRRGLTGRAGGNAPGNRRGQFDPARVAPTPSATGPTPSGSFRVYALFRGRCPRLRSLALSGQRKRNCDIQCW